MNTKEVCNKQYRRLPILSCAALTIVIIFLLSSSANAQTKFNGAQPAVFSGGDAFSVNGNTITITEASTPSFLDVNGGGVDQLLGISGIWIVNTSGASISGPTATTGDGFVTGTSPKTDWAAESNPPGFGGTTGYSSNGSWIDLVDASTLASFGKTPSGFTTGTFTFTGSGLPSTYDIGIDYLIANGSGNTKTGRAYFDAPSPSTDVAPESASFKLFGAGAIVLIGFALFARRRSQVKA